MGIFDSIVDKLTEGKDHLSGAPKKLVESTLEMIDQDKQGLKALTDKLSDAGLREQVKSWVDKGANLPVTAKQIKDAFDPKDLEMLALKTKLSVEEVTSHLAASLPQIVDKLTPDGKITAASLKEQGKGLLGKLGFGKKEDKTK